MEKVKICGGDLRYSMKRLERISCHNFVEVDGDIYFSNWFYNGLFKVEIKTGRTTFLGYFNDENLTERNIHWELFLKGKRIFFLPRRGSHVHIYDLTRKSIESIEIRNATDEFDVIIEVIMQEDYLIFFPYEKKFPIKRLDLTTLKVENVDEGSKIKGKYLSEQKEIFPAPELLEQYDIEGRDFFSWKKIMNGKWCGFMPMGRQMLWYTEGIPKLEMIPLILTNDVRLKKYLYNLGLTLMKEEAVQESRFIGVGQLDDRFLNENITSYDYFVYNNIGKKVWKIVREKDLIMK